MTHRRILLLGKNGQIGWALQRALAILGDVIGCDRDSCDLDDVDMMRAVVREVRPLAIVNAAAYTAVDRAESEPERAQQVNGVAPGVLAEEAERIGALLVHYSTDYVFDGKKGGEYLETDAPSPLGAYGRSKLAGEEAIRSAGSAHLIFRTSWVYGFYGRNFAKTILTLARQRRSLQVVADQTGAPTSADLVADVTAHCLRAWFTDPPARDRYAGLYHVTASGETSWHGFACELVRAAEAAGLPLEASTERIDAISSRDYPTAAKRPANSRLATGKIADVFGIEFPPWQLQAQRLIAEIAAARP